MNFDTGADEAASDRKAPIDEQAHGKGDGVPAAGGEATKERAPGRILAEVKRLWVELRSEADDSLLFDFDGSTGEAVIQIEEAIWFPR